MTHNVSSTADVSSETGRSVVPVAFATLAACLALPLWAIWSVDGFVTQDGPAHLYNAEIIASSFRSNSPFADIFQVRRQLLPNWTGQLIGAALVSSFDARNADRLLTSLTLVALPVSLLWLRLRVSGTDGLITAAPWAALLGLNASWLFGFQNFVLGAALFPVALGIWWNGRDEGMSKRRGVSLAFWLTLGYFSHLVSVGLSAIGMILLEVSTPGLKRNARWITTNLGFIPLLMLAPIYRQLMKKGGGGLKPEWKHLNDPTSLRSWIDQLTWVDPISLSRKDYLPLFGTVARWHNAFSPVVWLGLALTLILLPPFRYLKVETRGWWVLGFALLLIGLLGPDTLGATHGEYLQQRIVLLGLVSLVPVLPLDRGGFRGWGAALAVLMALLMQSLTVCDYGRWSDRSAGAILKEIDWIGKGERVATLLNGIKSPFRANPLLHADCALGIGNGNVIWANYETRFYYFPVQFRDGLEHPDPWAFEKVALSDDPSERLKRWKALVDRDGRYFDRVIVWGREPSIDAFNSSRFSTLVDHGGLRILGRKRDE